jgi:hypothetical protein
MFKIGGNMQILEVKEHKDGSATMTYTISTKEVEMFKEMAKQQKKMYSTRFVNSSILKALREAMELEKVDQNTICTKGGKTMPGKKKPIKTGGKKAGKK